MTHLVDRTPLSFDRNRIYPELCHIPKPQPEHWKDRRACEHIPLDVFFPDEEEIGKKAAEAMRKLAKGYCAECVVRRQCLDYALAMDCKAGIYGGTTPSERRKLQRRRAA